MADRGLPRPSERKTDRHERAVARLESPLANQLRAHPAAADGYRSRWDGWSTRVFVEMRPPFPAFWDGSHRESSNRLWHAIPRSTITVTSASWPTLMPGRRL